MAQGPEGQLQDGAQLEWTSADLTDSELKSASHHKFDPADINQVGRKCKMKESFG